MMMMDGRAARALGDLARERWRTSQEGLTLPPPPPTPPAEPGIWPPFIEPAFRDVRMAIARTEPAWRDRVEARETEALHLKAIALARRTIYLENQYFTSVIIGEALARRLAEPDGPEVVLVSTLHSPSYFDRWTMDRTRWRLVERLKRADRHGRFRAFCPHTEEGQPIIVHSKTSIIDDRVLRVGSTNLNHRSAGFDTECDVAMQIIDDAVGQAGIAAFRARLLGHYLGVGAAAVAAEIEARGGVGLAIEALDAGPRRRLAPLPPVLMGPLAQIVSAFHLGDPASPEDSWRPLMRRRRLEPYEQALDQAAASAAKAEVHD
jgi:phosphatidylserine/phosphatidylglycerophosphate/cardiolipin synthase-like enzyme